MAQQQFTQERVGNTAPVTESFVDVPIIDPPGQTPGLTAQEQSEELAESIREGIRNRPVATWRSKVFADLLKIMDEKGDLEGVWEERHALMAVLDPIARKRYPAQVIRAALETLLADTRKVLDPAAEVKRMVPEVRAAVLRAWGLKGQAIHGMLEELATLEGLSIGVDQYQEAFYDDYCDADMIAMAIREFADDPDVQIIAKAYRLARKIREAEGDC